MLSSDQSFKLEAMADASMQTKDVKTNVRESIIISKRSQNVVHAISWRSWIAWRIAQSTVAAMLLADADAVDKHTYFKHLLEETSDNQTTELVLD